MKHQVEHRKERVGYQAHRQAAAMVDPTLLVFGLLSRSVYQVSTRHLLLLLYTHHHHLHNRLSFC
jgi:hypothetical protein